MLQREVYRCAYCHRRLCVWQEYEEQMLEMVDIEVESTSSRSMPNNTKRKIAYQYMTRVIEGYLGSGNRVQLPQCVVDAIREQYPDKNNNYMGFKES